MATKVVLSSKPAVFGAGEHVVVGGRVKGAPAGTVVKLQRVAHGSWKNVGSTKAAPKGTFAVGYRAAASTSTTRLRVVVPVSSKVKGSRSASFVLRPRESVKVTAGIAGGPFLAGERVSVRGTVSSTHAAVAVRLEALHGSTWHAVARGSTSAAGAYALAMPAAAASTVLRVVAPRVGQRDAGVSPAVTARHYTCEAGRAPATGMALFRNVAVTGSGYELSTSLTRVVCAAAKGATIRISLFILDASAPQVAPILRALQAVHVERGVRVQFVLESRNSGLTEATLARLRAFSSVVVCSGGCTTRGPNASVMHDKVVAINDTIWRSGADPVVVLGSANWSARQLHAYWQTLTVFHDDARLYSAHARAFDQMRRCATTPCAAAVASSDVQTDPGRGMSVQLFPQQTGDPTVDTMRTITCGAGSRVRVAMYFGSGWRASRIAREMKRLVGSGCRVSILLSETGPNLTPASSLRELVATGASIRCASLMHTKFAVYDDVTVAGAAHQVVITDGSQNWTSSGLRNNDDATFALSTAAANQTWAPRIRTLATSYGTAWSAIAARAHACT